MRLIGYGSAARESGFTISSPILREILKVDIMTLLSRQFPVVRTLLPVIILATSLIVPSWLGFVKALSESTPLQVRVVLGFGSSLDG